MCVQQCASLVLIDYDVIIKKSGMHLMKKKSTVIVDIGIFLYTVSRAIVGCKNSNIFEVFAIIFSLVAKFSRSVCKIERVSKQNTYTALTQCE